MTLKKMGDEVCTTSMDNGLFGSLFISINLSEKLTRIGMYDHGYEIFDIDELCKFKSQVFRALVEIKRENTQYENLELQFGDLFIRYDIRLKLLYIGITDADFEVFDIGELIYLNNFLNRKILRLKLNI